MLSVLSDHATVLLSAITGGVDTVCGGLFFSKRDVWVDDTSNDTAKCELKPVRFNCTACKVKETVGEV